MIPTEEQAKLLWEKYGLPDKKREHVALVARVALYLARRVKSKTSKASQKSKINEQLLLAGRCCMTSIKM